MVTNFFCVIPRIVLSQALKTYTQKNDALAASWVPTGFKSMRFHWTQRIWEQDLGHSQNLGSDEALSLSVRKPLSGDGASQKMPEPGPHLSGLTSPVWAAVQEAGVSELPAWLQGATGLSPTGSGSRTETTWLQSRSDPGSHPRATSSASQTLGFLVCQMFQEAAGRDLRDVNELMSQRVNISQMCPLDTGVGQGPSDLLISWHGE